MYRKLEESELEYLSKELIHYSLWKAVRTFIQQFYADTAYSFMVSSAGQYDDQSSVNYHVEDMVVFDEDDLIVHYDITKPAFALMYSQDIMPSTWQDVNYYDLYNHGFSEDSKDKDLVLLGDLPPLRSPSPCDADCPPMTLTFHMDYLTNLELYLKFVEDLEVYVQEYE